MASPSIQIVTLTDYVTVTPVPTATSSSILPTLSTFATSRYTSPLSSSISTSTASPTTTTSPLQTPSAHLPTLPKQPFNDSYAVALLVAVSIMALLLCSLFGYIIYLRCKGTCPHCTDTEAQLRKWERGDLKRITKDMVRKRETLNSMWAEDVEKRGADVDAETARAEALGKLEGGVVGREVECEKERKAPFWHKIVEMGRRVVGGGGKRASDPSPKDTHMETEAADRFFRVDVSTVSLQHPEPTAHRSVGFESPGEPQYHVPSPRYSPSVYSRATQQPQRARTRVPEWQGFDNVEMGGHEAARDSYRPADWRRYQRPDGFF